MEYMCLDFINSAWYLRHKVKKELFYDEKWIADFCAKWNLDKEVFTQQAEKLIEVRTFLYKTVLDVIKNQTLSTKATNELNKMLQKTHLVYELTINDKEGTILQTATSAKASNRIEYEAVLSFCQFVSEVPTERIKLCDNPDCGWVFYDESKSKNKKWCDNTCASLMKVRKHRAKQKEAL